MLVLHELSFEGGKNRETLLEGPQRGAGSPGPGQDLSKGHLFFFFFFGIFFN